MDASSPPCLVLPALLDFQPVVLQLDVRRDAAVQFRRFCRSHGLDPSKCPVLHEALGEIVDLQKRCRYGGERDLPSFVVVKNVLVPGGASVQDDQPHGGATFSWVHDTTENLAIDLCRFVESSGVDVGGAQCVVSLGGAIQQSFEWINSLKPCDQTDHIKEEIDILGKPAASRRAEHSQLSDRIAAVEQLIAEVTVQQREDGLQIVQEASQVMQDHGPSIADSQETKQPCTNGSEDAPGALTPPTFIEVALAKSGADHLTERQGEPLSAASRPTMFEPFFDANGPDNFSLRAHRENDEGKRSAGPANRENGSSVGDFVGGSPTTIVGETSSANKQQPRRLQETRQSASGASIGMSEQDAESINTPSPEVLRVTATLAMLFFIFYLVFDLVSIAISSVTSMDALQKRASQGGAYVVSRFTAAIYGEPDSSSVDDAPLVQESAEERDISCEVSNALIPATPPSPQSRQNVFHCSSTGSLSPFDHAFQRRVQALDRVATSYRCQLQRAAFGFWRVGPIQVGQSVALTPRSLQDEGSSSSPEESSQKRRTSFTCMSMALLFARHGSYFHQISPTGDDQRRVHPQLSRSFSELLRSGRISVDKMPSEDRSQHIAARKIQRAWRVRQQKPVRDISIATDAPTPSTPLFKLLKQKFHKKQLQTSRPYTKLATLLAARQGNSPASSLRLPPMA